MVFPAIPLFARQMGYSEFWIGAAVSGFSLLSLVLALPLGNLSDRFSARSLLVASAFFNLAYSMLLLLAENIAMLIAAQMLGGLGFLFMIVSSQTWVSAHEGRGTRERGFGFLSLAAAVGQTIGPFLGGFLLSRTSFSALFILATALSLPGFSIAALKSRVAEGERRKKVPPPSPRRAAGTLLSDRRMLAVLVLTFVAVFAASLRSSFAPVLFKERGMDESIIGLLLSAFALAMTMVRLFIGRVMGRLRRGVLLAVSLGLFLAATAVLPSIAAAWLAAVVMFFFGLGFGISQPLSMVMISDRSGHTSGMAMGLRFSVITLATLLSPLATGFVVEQKGLAAGFYLVSGLVGAAAFLIHRLAYQKKRGERGQRGLPEK
jgi:MFS family permease